MQTDSKQNQLILSKIQDIDNVLNYHKEHPNLEYSNPEDIFAIAAAFYQKSLFNDCTEFAIKYITIVCQDPNFCALVGSAYRKNMYFDKALELYQAGLFVCSDSLQLKNNLANLYIDMNMFDDSEALLLEVLRIDPDYIDAKENLKRLYLLKAQGTNLFTDDIVSSEFSNTQQDGFPFTIEQFDPLLNAFSSAEATVSSTSALPSPSFVENVLVLDEILRGVEDSVDTNLVTELLSVARSFNSIDPHKALEQCDACYRKFGAYPPTFQVAGEAHLILGNLDKAKGYLLTSLHLGHKNVTLCLNLASISLSQNDLSLYKYWLSQAEQFNSELDIIASFKNNVASAIKKLDVSNYNF